MLYRDKQTLENTQTLEYTLDTAHNNHSIEIIEP